MKLLLVLWVFILFQPTTARNIVQNYHTVVEKAVVEYPFIVDGREIHIEPSLIYAVIYQESRGNPHAKSPVGAYGLMQMMPKTAQLAQCKYSELGSPDVAIFCGVKFLAALMTYNRGNMVKTLSGYNGGT